MTLEEGSEGNQEGGEKLIGGKFKTTDELLAAYESTQRELGVTKESLDRETRLNDLLGSNSQPAQKPQTSNHVSDYAPLLSVLDEDQAKVVGGYIENKIAQLQQNVFSAVNDTITQAEAKRYAADKFYTLYPDMKGYEDVVDAQATKLTASLGQARVAKMTFEELAKEVYAMSRTQISTLRKKFTKSPLHLEGGSEGEPTFNKAATAPKITSAEDRARAYFDEKKKAGK